uniref:Uncharacterized protein n=1 Tax=Timema genevievae TaxID=629358 RepID=A0A7R9PLS9_TIMGE|nr:unnamed protein product [Timema genevievae]
MRPKLTVVSHTKLFPCLLTPKLTTVYTPSYSLVSLPSELTTRSCYLGLHIATLVLKDPRSKEQNRYNLEAVGLCGIEIHSAGQKCPDPWLRASPGPNPTLDNSYVGIPLPTQFIRVGFKPQTSHRRCVLPSKNLTAKCMSTNKSDPDPDMVPLKFTTSKAATWKAVETRGGEEDDWPWFQSYVISLSVGIFLIYFCILREENDVDQDLSKSLYDRISGLEEKQLFLVLDYNKEHGLPTDEIKARYVATLAQPPIAVNANRRMSVCTCNEEVRGTHSLINISQGYIAINNEQTTISEVIPIVKGIKLDMESNQDKSLGPILPQSSKSQLEAKLSEEEEPPAKSSRVETASGPMASFYSCASKGNIQTRPPPKSMKIRATLQQINFLLKSFGLRKCLTKEKTFSENLDVERNPDCNCCSGDEVDGEKLPSVFLSFKELPGMFTGAELPSKPDK